jgi:molybdate transport system substrate-binding protein
MTKIELRLLSSMATRDLLAELAAVYSRQSSQALSAAAGGGVDVAARVRADEPLDIVVLGKSVVDQLTVEAKLLTGSRVDLVQSGVAVAVRNGAARFDISSESAVEQAVRAAKSLGYSTGPSGLYLEKLFERWGISQLVKGKLVVPPPGVPVGSLIASGQCELGFQQLSELMNLPGIDLLGPLPSSIQLMTTFSGGIAATSRSVEAAQAALAFLASPATAAAKRQHGMEPA